MRSSTLFIISFFLVAKAFQLMNVFVLSRLTNNEFGSEIMTRALLLLGAMFLIFALLKIFLPKYVILSGMIWLFGIIVLTVTGIINESWAYICLPTTFLLVLISAEAQIFHSLSKFRNIPRIIPLAVSMLPALGVYFIPMARETTPILLYIFTTIVVFTISYSQSVYGSDTEDKGDKSPLLLGLAFMMMSGLIYYAATSFNDVDTFVVGSVMAFYAAGASVVYTALDGYLRRLDRV